jgi:hypothetical protein
MENNILFIEVIYKYKYYYGYVTENIFKILDSKLEIKETVFTEMLKTGVFKIRNTENTKIDKKIKIC